jgi:hypothetical protein
VSKKDAEGIIENSRGAVRQWRTIADRLGLHAGEKARMAAAFRLAE